LESCVFNSSRPAIRALDLDDGVFGCCIVQGPDGNLTGNDDALLELGGKIEMRDSEIAGGGTQLRIRSGVTTALSTTFSSERVEVMESAGLSVQWRVNAAIYNKNGTLAQSARLNVTDHLNQSKEVPAPGGIPELGYMIEYWKTYNETVFYSPYWFNASEDGLTCDLSVNVDHDMDLNMVLRDTSAPAINITAPVNGSFLNRSQVIVNGSASDETGNVSVRVRVDSGPWITAGGAGNWSLPLDLAGTSSRPRQRTKPPTARSHP